MHKGAKDGRGVEQKGRKEGGGVRGPTAIVCVSVKASVVIVERDWV